MIKNKSIYFLLSSLFFISIFITSDPIKADENIKLEELPKSISKALSEGKIVTIYPKGYSKELIELETTKIKKHNGDKLGIPIAGCILRKNCFKVTRADGSKEKWCHLVKDCLR